MRNRTAIKGSTPARASYKVSYEYAPCRCRWIRWPCRCVSCSVRSRRWAYAFWSPPSSPRLAGRRVVRTFALWGARAVSVTRAARSTAQWGKEAATEQSWCVVRVANYFSQSVALPCRSAVDINNRETNDFVFVEVYHQNVSKDQLMARYTWRPIIVIRFITVAVVINAVLLPRYRF